MNENLQVTNAAYPQRIALFNFIQFSLTWISKVSITTTTYNGVPRYLEKLIQIYAYDHKAFPIKFVAVSKNDKESFFFAYKDDLRSYFDTLLRSLNLSDIEKRRKMLSECIPGPEAIFNGSVGRKIRNICSYLFG